MLVGVHRYCVLLRHVRDVWCAKNDTLWHCAMRMVGGVLWCDLCIGGNWQDLCLVCDCAQCICAWCLRSVSVHGVRQMIISRLPSLRRS